MRKQLLQSALASMMAMTLCAPSALHAEEVTLPVRDHWDFESTSSNMGERTEATLNGAAITDSDSTIFGKVLHFPAGADKYLRLADYMETGSGSCAFSLWYNYDTSITGDGATSSAVLLQHEGSGKTILSLRSDGKYHTYLNASDVLSDSSVEKGGWQHITISFDQTTKKVQFYINGELDCEKDLGDTLTTGTLSLRLGAHKNAGSTDPHCMRGDVDEFYVFNSALNADQARTVYLEKGLDLAKEDLRTTLANATAETERPDFNALSVQGTALLSAMNAARTALEGNDYDAVRAAGETLRTALSAMEQTRPITLTVSDTAIRTIDPESIFGINHRYGFNAYATFDENTMKVRDEFKALYQQAGFGSIRYPGGSISNLFNWKTTLGPKSERKKQIHAFYNNGRQTGIAPNFGLGEISDFADEMDSEIVYVYSIARGGAQDAADLIEYLNAEVGMNPNGGVDWAAVRAANGHPEPYHVRHFEIGNETQQAYGQNADGTSTQAYWIDYRSSGSAVDAYILGAPIQVTEKYCVDEENWDKNASKATGEPNLVRVLRHVNGNPKLFVDGKLVDDPDFEAVDEGVCVYVGTDTEKTEWMVVDTLDNSGPNDTHCVVDRSNGEIHFGDGVHGAIPQEGKNIYATYTCTREGFNDISKAMKDMQAAINEASGEDREMNVYTAWQADAFITRENELGKADLYDGMTIHPYSTRIQNTSTPEAFYDEALQRGQGWCLNEVTHLVDLMPEGKVPVISEFGIYPNSEPQVRSQTHALYIAKCMMEYMKLGSPYIQKHCLSDYYSAGADALGPTQQAVIQVVPRQGANTALGTGEYDYFATPSAGIFEMFNSGFGDTLLESTLSSNPTLSNGIAAVNVLASKDSHGNYTIAINNTDRTDDLSFAIELPEGATGTKVSVQRLESAAIDTENDLEHPDNVKVTLESAERTENTVVTVKKHSFAIVRISSPADTSALEALVERAEALHLDDYVNTVDLTNRLGQSRLALDNPVVSQDHVDLKVCQLQHAIDSLERKLDFTQLDLVIAAISDADEADFTNTLAPLKEQAQAAEEWKSEADTQAAINEKARTLHLAWLACRYLPAADKLPQ